MNTDKEDRPRMGELPRRYLFALNPHADYRATRCPGCDRKTRLRKFALFVHVDPLYPLAMGKTCRFCPQCELIIAHQDEVEAELARIFQQIDPSAIGNYYLVIGTVERKAWREGMRQPRPIGEMLAHVADFKAVHKIEYQPPGWYPDEK